MVDTVLFRPLPFPNQHQLVSVTEGIPSLGFPVIPFSCPDYLFVAANNRSFETTVAYRTQSFEASGTGQPHRVQGARLTASTFQVLQVSPIVGRAFTNEEDEHATRVVVLSYGFARTTFGQPERALGRTILLDRTPYTIIGIMPRSFSFPIRGSRFNDGPAELFVPVSWSKDDRKQNVSDFDFSMIARLRPTVTIHQANAEMQGLLKRLRETHPPEVKRSIRQGLAISHWNRKSFLFARSLREMCSGPLFCCWPR